MASSLNHDWCTYLDDRDRSDVRHLIPKTHLEKLRKLLTTCEVATQLKFCNGAEVYQIPLPLLLYLLR